MILEKLILAEKLVKKFIIIDHSLCNLQGHHYECSVSVAEAAARQGYQPFIIANHTFPQADYPQGIKVISAFEIDWFNNPVYSQELLTWKQSLEKIVAFLNDKHLERLYQKFPTFML